MKNETPTTPAVWTDATVLQLLDERDTSRGRLGSVRAMLNFLAQVGGCGEQEMAILGCIDLIDTVMDLNDTPRMSAEESERASRLQVEKLRREENLRRAAVTPVSAEGRVS